MRAQMFWKACCYFGFLSLLHAAFSAAQHKSYRRIVFKEVLNESTGISSFLATSLPLDIVLQAVMSCLLILASLVASSGSFQEIRTLDDLNQKPKHAFENLPSLYRFCHRGRILR